MRRLPVKTLKIDREFVDGLARSLSDLGGSKRGSGRARPFRSGFEAHSGSM
ncbi:hypothetical protein G3480_18235 [Thiorhodococcus mannitoliphagus]|uniref:Uncharacterized protein n=1 Tax=Thiorhodococcus mannitoliphagus TaxID=329406 RepID=A0A6P1DX08_9GAMM|nr:hypothetical protein [Thiorhodococcus mannitoliphagus]